jgi:hypothetical protein
MRAVGQAGNQIGAKQSWGANNRNWPDCGFGQERKAALFISSLVDEHPPCGISRVSHK